MKLNLQFFAGMAATGTKIGYAATSSGPHTEIPGLLEGPESGGDPEKIDTTTLTDTVKTSVPGVKDLGDLTFKFLYDTETFKTLNELKGKQSFRVTFPDKMTVTFDAIPNVKMGSAAVNSALTFTVGMSLQSAPEFETES